ncbi:MAG: (Fe-S)-binding protein [Desulfarculus sp.]|nr:(Fe-S)-binding protein [Desulfarculus sp.]
MKEASAVIPAARRVSFFATCLVDGLLPQVGLAALAVLRGQGLLVDPRQDQVCCGQSLYKAGHARQAASVGAAWVRAFSGAEVVVSPSGSCVAHVRHALPGLLAGWPDLAAEARRLASRTFELSQYLFRVLGVTPALGRAPGRPWVYHPSCGLHRSLGEDEAPRALLGALPGPPALDLPRQAKCCGFGGPFSVTHPELSAAMLADKLAAVREAGARVLVVGDVGCMLHLSCGVAERGGGLEVVHLAQVLAGEVA